MENIIIESSLNLEYYSENHLRNLAEMQLWKGNGLQHNPFIVENANILGQTILVKSSTIHFSFVNCHFEYVKFEECQNITLKDCSFEKLVLKGCKNFKFDSCYISKLSSTKVNQICFKHSIIVDILSNRKFKNIIFEDCQINDNS